MDFPYALLLTALLLVIFTILMSVINKQNLLEKRVKNMNDILNQIAKQMNIPEHPVNDELRALLKDGKTAEAVKRARENLGFSLIEAKKYVDEL